MISRQELTLLQAQEAKADDEARAGHALSVTPEAQLRLAASRGPAEANSAEGLKLKVACLTR
jgi:hypothetical protein